LFSIHGWDYGQIISPPPQTPPLDLHSVVIHEMVHLLGVDGLHLSLPPQGGIEMGIALMEDSCNSTVPWDALSVVRGSLIPGNTFQALTDYDRAFFQLAYPVKVTQQNPSPNGSSVDAQPDLTFTVKSTCDNAQLDTTTFRVIVVDEFANRYDYPFTQMMIQLSGSKSSADVLVPMIGPVSGQTNVRVIAGDTCAGLGSPARVGIAMWSFEAGPPSADFTATPTSGSAPLQVQFTDTTLGTVTSRTWNFGDGSSSSQNDPSHTYSSAGVYSVSETVIGPGGTDTETKNNFITVNGGSPCIDSRLLGQWNLASVNGTPIAPGVFLRWEFTTQSLRITSDLDCEELLSYCANGSVVAGTLQQQTGRECGDSVGDMGSFPYGVNGNTLTVTVSDPRLGVGVFFFTKL
jgi:hypothetical protein